MHTPVKIFIFAAAFGLSQAAAQKPADFKTSLFTDRSIEFDTGGMAPFKNGSRLGRSSTMAGGTAWFSVRQFMENGCTHQH